MERFAAIAFIGAGAGLLGSMVGLGGGIILIPAMTLALGVPIHHAIAAGLVAVIANSSMASSGNVRDEVTNVRLGMALETATTVGAVAGGTAAAFLDRALLSAIFAVFLLLNAAYLLLRPAPPEAAPAGGAGRGLLDGRYHDPSLRREVSYRVTRLPVGLAVSALAGAVSGLLGIGGGPIKVPMMTGVMGVPIKAAAATSNFMIGVTACASAALYYRRGMVSPAVAVPAALGATVGAWAGSKLAARAKGAHLERLLAAILSVLAVKMALSVWRGA
ncbi:MAG: sulfite exporter TauE/SafE family protein [Elusimicrobiota bacterium]|nr:sulfite exporter TauE/SafE family protein [Elusimicrobiota bacterium]